MIFTFYIITWSGVNLKGSRVYTSTSIYDSRFLRGFFILKNKFIKVYVENEKRYMQNYGFFSNFISRNNKFSMVQICRNVMIYGDIGDGYRWDIFSHDFSIIGAISSQYGIFGGMSFELFDLFIFQMRIFKNSFRLINVACFIKLQKQ